MNARCGICVLLQALVIGLVVADAAPAQEQPKAVKGNAPPTAQPVMTLKVYDAEGNVLVNIKRKVRPRPKNNAFDVMRAIVTVDFDTYAGDLTAKPPLTGGAFVNAIAGVIPPPNNYWFLYVDGVKSKDKGICDITITKDTLVEWKIEEYKPDSK